jgi:hypothetical protein
MITGATALVIGLILSPLVGRGLPFGLDGRVAAMVMGADRRHAGAILMKEGNPDAWRDLESTAALGRSNQAVLTACRQAAIKAQKDQHCALVVQAP